LNPHPPGCTKYPSFTRRSNTSIGLTKYTSTSEIL
jgi:hypothetical protein